MNQNSRDGMGAAPATSAAASETAPSVSLEIASPLNCESAPAKSKVSTLSKLSSIIAAKGKVRSLLLVISVLSMSVGFVAGALLTRFYFANGGNRKWLSTWLQTSGWPLLALATGIIYWQQGLRPSPLTPGLAVWYLLLGILAGFDNFLYAWGIAYLPASTFGLLTSSQLAFNAVFALLINKQKITPYCWNAIVLVSSSAVILALHSDGDKLPGVTRSQYVSGYIVTIAASALYGLFYPLTELVFRRHLAGRSNKVVLEMQVCLSVVATFVALSGMGVNGDFRVLEKEARGFKAGRFSGYSMTLVWTAIAWQIGSLGAVGIIFLSSSLLAGVVLTVTIPLLSIFAVVFFQESFGGLKAMSMILSLWGLISYIYGGYVESKDQATKV